MVRGHPVCPLAYGDKMGMTGVEPAYLGLKVRCIAVMLHAQMSHTGIAPTGLEPDISALKGLCPIRSDDGAMMGHRGFEPRSYGLRVRYSTVILMTQDSPHRALDVQWTSV